LTCATGGRPDHALAVIGLLAQYRKMVPDLVEDDYDMCILSPEGLDSWEFTGEIGKTFSAIALEPGTSISIDGMRWNLDGFDLPLLSDRGVSNIILEDGAKVWCEEGCLAAFLIK
jgi:thiamine pyrophosphokinase